MENGKAFFRGKNAIFCERTLTRSVCMLTYKLICEEKSQKFLLNDCSSRVKCRSLSDIQNGGILCKSMFLLRSFFFGPTTMGTVYSHLAIIMVMVRVPNNFFFLPECLYSHLAIIMVMVRVLNNFFFSLNVFIHTWL